MKISRVIFGVSRERPSRAGFTLIELVVYVALLGLISVFVADNLSQIVFTFNRARAEREVINNARRSFERVTKEIQESSSVYAPSSSFNVNLSQISLQSPANPTSEHASNYVDIYVDNGRLYLRREGEASSALTSNRVVVTEFRAEHIIQSLNREAVKITYTVSYNTSSSKLSTSATLDASVALRGSY